ncbi:hypothetical protein Bca101_027275 [Brassica carinata]
MLGFCLMFLSSFFMSKRVKECSIVVTEKLSVMYSSVRCSIVVTGVFCMDVSMFL